MNGYLDVEVSVQMNGYLDVEVSVQMYIRTSSITLYLTKHIL